MEEREQKEDYWGDDDKREEVGEVGEDEVDQAEAYREQQSNKGVCYMSRIPPYMKPNYIRKLLASYSVQRIYLLAESQFTHKNRVRKGGNKKICFREGWIQFQDKQIAKTAAFRLNGQKMVAKKGSFYSQDLWTLKYLPKFKWHHLTERLAHESRLKKERLKMELEQEDRVETFYEQNLGKSVTINQVIKSKRSKGKTVDQTGRRQFAQVAMAKPLSL